MTTTNQLITLPATFTVELWAFRSNGAAPSPTWKRSAEERRRSR